MRRYCVLFVSNWRAEIIIQRFDCVIIEDIIVPANSVPDVQPCVNSSDYSISSLFAVLISVLDAIISFSDGPDGGYDGWGANIVVAFSVCGIVLLVMGEHFVAWTSQSILY